MKRRAYSAGAVKVMFWFMEFRKMVGLLDSGMSFDEIKEMNEEENIFGASTKTRRTQIYNSVSARIKCMDESFYQVFLSGNVTAQKQFALAAVMAYDTLFFEFVDEVIHEKLLIGNNELIDADMRKFFHGKQVQDERVAQWTEETVQRLGRTYVSILMEAGIIEKARMFPRKIYTTFLDFAVENWLKEHDMQEIIKALSDR